MAEMVFPMIRQAKFSSDGKRRFELIRDWDDGFFIVSGTVNFVMLNPSIANGKTDDPTVRKCVGFAKRWGYARIVVTNLIPIVATDPWSLPPWSGVDAENKVFLQKWATESDLVVAAWGSQPKAVVRTIALAEHIYCFREIAPAVLHCIGMTKSGSPKHPSRAEYTEEPIVYA